jgi:hypothetical protein
MFVRSYTLGMPCTSLETSHWPVQFSAVSSALYPQSCMVVTRKPYLVTCISEVYEGCSALTRHEAILTTGPHSVGGCDGFESGCAHGVLITSAIRLPKQIKAMAPFAYGNYEEGRGSMVYVAQEERGSVSTLTFASLPCVARGGTYQHRQVARVHVGL